MGLWVGLTTPKVTAGTLSFFIGQKEINLDSSFFFYPSQVNSLWPWNCGIWRASVTYTLLEVPKVCTWQLSKPSVLCMEILAQNTIKAT